MRWVRMILGLAAFILFWLVMASILSGQVASAAQTFTLTTQQKVTLTVPAQVVITAVEPRWQFNACFDTEFILAANGKSVTVNAGLTSCIDFLRLYITGTVNGAEKQIAKNFWVEIVDEKASQVSVTIGNAVPK